MKRSADRILTTHCGSLARPKDLLDLLKAKVKGENYDESTLAERTRRPATGSRSPWPRGKS